MSTAHDAHSTQAHDAHPFDGEPVKELPPDEPRTPGWVPALGLLLFVVAGIALLAGGSGGGSSDKAAPSAAAPDDRGAQVRPASPTDAPALRPAPAPGQSAIPAVTKLSPEQAKALQQRIEQARARQPAPGGQPAEPGQPPLQPQPAPQPGSPPR